jgi:hypothetical protein
MFRKLTYTILIITALALMVGVVGAQDGSPRVWLISEIEQMTAGQEFAVSIQIEGGSQLYGGTFEIAYDPALMEVIPGENNIAVTPGGFFGAGPSFTLSNMADARLGSITYALTLTQPAEPVSGDGQVGTLRFRALGDGSVKLELTESSLVSPEFTEVDGQLVAQKINSIEAQPAAMVIGAIPGADGVAAAPPPIDLAAQAPAAPEVAAPAEVVAPTSAPADTGSSASVASALGNTAVAAAPAAGANGNGSSILMIAGLLFLFGMALLTISVGMYSRMRAQFSLKTERLPEYVS